MAAATSSEGIDRMHAAQINAILLLDTLIRAPARAGARERDA